MATNGTAGNQTTDYQYLETQVVNRGEGGRNPDNGLIAEPVTMMVQILVVMVDSVLTSSDNAGN